MCVKICYKDGTMKDFCESKSLLDQLNNADHIHISVIDDMGRDAEKFIKTFKNQLTLIPPLDMRVEVQNSIIGKKIEKKIKKLNKNLAVSWLIKEMVHFQKDLDKSLLNIKNEIKGV